MSDCDESDSIQAEANRHDLAPAVMDAVVNAIKRDGWQIVKLGDMGDGSGGYEIVEEM